MSKEDVKEPLRKKTMNPDKFLQCWKGYYWQRWC